METRSIDVAIARIRRKIEDDLRYPIYLQTVRGIGWMLQTHNDKIDHEFRIEQTPNYKRTCKCMFDEFYAPSFVLGKHTYLPGTLSKVCDRVNSNLEESCRTNAKYCRLNSDKFSMMLILVYYKYMKKKVKKFMKQKIKLQKN